MSEFKVFKSKMTDTNLAVQILEEMRPDWKGHIEVGNDIHLLGYQGDDRAKKSTSDKNYAPPCEARVPGEGSSHKLGKKNCVGSASNDIGIVRESDGTLSLIVSQYDSSRYNHEWQQGVANKYSLREGQMQAVQGGAEVSQEMPCTDPQWGACIGSVGRIPRSKLMALQGV